MMRRLSNAGQDRQAPEVFERLCRHYGEFPPLSKMAGNRIFRLLLWTYRAPCMTLTPALSRQAGEGARALPLLRPLSRQAGEGAKALPLLRPPLPPCGRGSKSSPSSPTPSPALREREQELSLFSDPLSRLAGEGWGEGSEFPRRRSVYEFAVAFWSAKFTSDKSEEFPDLSLRGTKRRSDPFEGEEHRWLRSPLLLSMEYQPGP